MIEGAVMHRDSSAMSSDHAGQVNLMTAGRGIAHAEDSESAVAAACMPFSCGSRCPMESATRAGLSEYPHLPLVELGGFSVRVLAGSAFGHTRPPRSIHRSWAWIGRLRPARISVP